MDSRANRKRATSRRRGFTLIEVMIVLAIVLALGAIVSVAVLSRKDEANIQLAKTDLTNLEKGLKWFYFKYNRYPTDEEGLAVLWSAETLDPELDESQWSAQLEKPLAKDRWGHEWMYMQQRDDDPAKYALWSVGPDGEDGTEDDLKTWSEDDEMGSDFGFEDMAPSGSGG
ncbi:MAG: type II secretion system protein GspG [Leptolyngbya sp. PLA3]|nr:MAG: type II secretion system protein GspG [Cyanobacteria bacterium CYA]MCE7968170.1 type II secretion system protein GspG [Leptolyngbya sp. PL-A3]